MIAENKQPAAVQVHLPVLDHVSHSSISCFQQCPLKWRFRYVDKLEEDFKGVALVFGSSVHAAVERHFQSILETGGPPTLEQLLEAFDECWQSFDAASIRYGKNDDAESMRELAVRMLETFQGSEFAKPTGTIVAVEESMRGEFVQGMPDVLARVDLAVQDGDELVLTDFKTSRSRWNANQAQSNAEQLLLYADLAGRVLDGKRIKLQFAVVTKTKTPVLEVHEVCYDAARLKRSKAIFGKVWEAIKSGVYYPAPSQMNCYGCGYRKACDSFTG